MTIYRTYPPMFEVDTETGTITATAFDVPQDPMSPPTCRVRWTVTGTVETLPLYDPQEG